MNRSAEQTNRVNRFKKDTHSLIERKDGFNHLAVFNLKHQAFKIEHM